MTQAGGALTLNAAKLRIGSVQRQIIFPYWAALAQGISARAAELEVELCLPTSDAGEEWEAAVEQVVRQRPDVAILPYSVIHVFPEAFQSFKSAGIPLIGVDMAASAAYASVVRADEAQGARLVIAYLFERMYGAGKVANISGPRITDRQLQFHEMLQQHPDITLAYEGAGDWTRTSGAQVMEAALAAHPDLRGVFAHNDLMAIGAAEVIAERGMSAQIVVVGFDADPEGLIGIHDRRLAATVYRGMYSVGRTAVDAAVRVARGEQLAPEIYVPVKLITAANLVDATLDTTSMLPGLLRDLVESSQAQRQLQQETIAAQRSIIRELSTPIIPISDAILIVPLIGTIDSARAQQIMEAMLQAIGEHGAQFLIIDITGIAIVDTAIAHHLLQAARAIQLLGARVILVGISPEVAQTLVGLGVDFSAIATRATLQIGFEYAQRQLARVKS